VSIPKHLKPIKVERIFEHLKRHYRATLIGIAKSETKINITGNPDLDFMLSPEDKIFYIAEKLIIDIRWQEFIEA
jgi:hypothetical protein